MVHVHGAQVQQLVAQTRGVPPERLLAVPIDVGKAAAVALVCDFTGQLLARRFQFALTRVGVAELVRRVQAVRAARPVELVRVGIEAAGHYHRPLISAGVLPVDWQLVELNPAHVAAQRRTKAAARKRTRPAWPGRRPALAPAPPEGREACLVDAWLTRSAPHS